MLGENDHIRQNSTGNNFFGKQHIHIYKYVGDNKRLWRQMMCLYNETHPDLPPPRGRCWKCSMLKLSPALSQFNPNLSIILEVSSSLIGGVWKFSCWPNMGVWYACLGLSKANKKKWLKCTEHSACASYPSEYFIYIILFKSQATL